MAQPSSPPATAVPDAAAQLVDQLETALDDLNNLPLPGTRTVATLHGITRAGDFLGPAANVIRRVGDLLAPADEPPRVFHYGDAVVYECRGPDGEPGLVPLRTGTAVERSAFGLLANLILCDQPRQGGTGTVQYPIPAKALAVVLADETLHARLARLDTYARRPLYSPDFVLLGPGYHREHRVLVHGPAVEPDLALLPVGERAIDRLPPRLRTLLAGFCFRGAADLTNYVGLLLTGFLVSFFLACGKGVALIDGNQPGGGQDPAGPHPRHPARRPRPPSASLHARRRGVAEAALRHPAGHRAVGARHRQRQTRERHPH